MSTANNHETTCIVADKYEEIVEMLQNEPLGENLQRMMKIAIMHLLATKAKEHRALAQEKAPDLADRG